MSLAAGSRLGPYEIVAPIGAGGMGEVYRARDERLKRDVAIKVLPASFSANTDRLRRFEQEAQAAGSLNHPNILAIYDIGTHHGNPYIVSELLEGETLRTRLAGGAFTPRRALGHALQIASGLAAAHEKGIVHRDLKPENIFVTKDGRVKILDFGLAKLMESENAMITQTDLPTAGTEPGMVLGTVGYMSPEQVRGKPADPRSDIFSFGAILYEMLSGKRAFRGDTTADTMSAILMKEPPELSTTNRAVSPGLDRVVRHCLEKDPERRFHSAHDLAFDLEALSDVAQPPIALAARPPARRIRIGAAVVAALLGLAATAVLLWPRVKTVESLAVLPFSNASADPNAEYLSDGITDALINSLSQLPNLTVMSRDSVSGYKKRDVSAQAAGRELNVQAVLKGKLLQRADDLVVTAELVDVRRNSHLWGGQFDRKLSDMQALQEEIAKQISAKLRGELSGVDKKRLTKRYTENPEAYQLYLKGQYFWEKRTEEPLRKSIEYFSQAIEKDPGYALAYAGLADSYAISTAYSFLAPRESMPKARAAAEKALEIEDDLARPHATLGFRLWTYDWDWKGAEGEFKKAISLDPRYSHAYHYNGLMFVGLGRSDEAVALLQRANELNPLSGIIHANLGRAYLYARQYDQAISVLRMAPDFAAAHRHMGQAYAAKGMKQEAVSEYQKAADLLLPNPQKLYHSGLAQALAGRESDALETINAMKALSAQRYVMPAYIAYIYSQLGRKEETLEWLERSYADHSFELVFVKVNPMWDLVRSDPRFTDLLRRMKLAS